MVARWWPGGEQPETAQPRFVVNAPPERGRSATKSGGTYAGPVTVSLYCATQGASLAYTMEQGEKPRWLLYTGPIRLPQGVTIVRARAIRYGYKESAELKGIFTIT